MLEKPNFLQKHTDDSHFFMCFITNVDIKFNGSCVTVLQSHKMQNIMASNRQVNSLTEIAATDRLFTVTQVAQQQLEMTEKIVTSNADKIRMHVWRILGNVSFHTIQVISEDDLNYLNCSLFCTMLYRLIFTTLKLISMLGK